MDPTLNGWIIAFAGCGVVGGLILLGRGLIDYRATVRVGDTSTSTISSLAAGEVRISGFVEVAEMTLVSFLQSAPCVYYRSMIRRDSDESTLESGFTEERSIGFCVRDASGKIRVFPRGARIDAPVRFDETEGALGDEPPSLAIRTGASTRLSEPDRATAIAELLEVHEPATADRLDALRARDRTRHYREARLEPGDAVTVVGRALPFSDLADPATADQGREGDLRDDDPEVAADLAAARTAGILETDPMAAWGNAAIPGLGIGRPVTAPEIDPAANRLPLATPEEAALVKRTFEIEPWALVLAFSAEVPLLIAYGTPGAVLQRSRGRFALGLLGAVLAIVSAMVFAIMISGGVDR